MDALSDEDADRPDTPEALDAALAGLAGRRGYHRRLDADHTATFVPRGGALIVTFEEVETTLGRDSGLPLSCDFADGKSWSMLHLSARRRSWFRSDAVFAFFDELADDPAFDEYDRVIFYGAGPGGYAAAAYSVAVPGARVIAVSPLASVDRTRAGWDERHRGTLVGGAASRFGFAPEMVEAAEDAFILFDPAALFDHVHASLFQGDNVTRLPVPGLGRITGVPVETTIEQMGALHPLIEGFGLGTLGRTEAYGLLRARRGHAPYLRALLGATTARGGDRLTALLCVVVLGRGRAPAFRRALREARGRLAAANALPDWLHQA